MGTFSWFQHNSKCIQLGLCSPTCHNRTELKIGGFIISQHNPAPFTKQKGRSLNAFKPSELQLDMLRWYSTTPFMHNCALRGASEDLLNGPPSIKDAGLTRQKSPQLAMDRTQSAKSILLCNGGEKKKLGFKRREAIKCLNIKNKTLYQKQWRGGK